MKKIAIASVATLGLLGAAAVPAFGAASSLTQAQGQTAAANVHCKVRHWAERQGYRDAIRADAFAGRKGHFNHGHKRHEHGKDVDHDRLSADAVEEDGNRIADAGVQNEWGSGYKRYTPHDVDVDERKHHRHRHVHDKLFWKRDAGRIAQRYKERKRWGTEKWCKGKPVAGVHAGGGWHAKSKRK